MPAAVRRPVDGMIDRFGSQYKLNRLAHKDLRFRLAGPDDFPDWAARLFAMDQKSLKTLAEAAGMGLMWGGCGLVPGFLMEGVDPDGTYADIWPAVFAGPLLFGGVAFYLLYRMLGRGRRLAQVPLTEAALWGALASLALAALFSFAVFVDFARWHGEPPPVSLRLAEVGAKTWGFAVAGCLTVLVARKSEPRPANTDNATDRV